MMELEPTAWKSRFLTLDYQGSPQIFSLMLVEFICLGDVGLQKHEVRKVLGIPAYPLPPAVSSSVWTPSVSVERLLQLMEQV